MKLEPGMVIRLVPGDVDTWEVLKVGVNALIRATRGDQRVFETRDGRQVDFEAPGKTMTISANAVVEVVDGSSAG